MKLFAVVGMHRSGTSAVSRMANLLGASLGPEADLMPSKPDNPRGFWESLSVTQLHDDLLGALGGPWNHPPILGDGWENDPRLDSFLTRAHGLVGSHFAGAEVAAWKDPRGSLLLPLWRRVTPIAGTILCLRSPLEVAASLRAREGLDGEQAAALWLTYTLGAFSNDPSCLIVPFDEVLCRPEDVAASVASFLGLPPPMEEVLAEIRTFLDLSARTPPVPDQRGGHAMRLAEVVHQVVTEAPRGAAGPLLRALWRGWQTSPVVTG